MQLLTTIGESLGLAVILIVILFFGKVALDLLIHLVDKRNADYELSENDNPAFGVSFFGYLLALAYATLSGITRSGLSYPADIALLVVHGAFSIAALLIAWVINTRCILYRVSDAEAIFGKRNVGVGLVEAGSFIATSLVLAGSWTSGGWGAVVLWFIVGQLIFILTTLVYQWIVPYDIHGQIEGDNRACAIGFGGFLIATGVLVGKAVTGPVTQLGPDLRDACLYLLVGLATLVCLRLTVGRLFLHTSKLNKEIALDRNPNAGLAEAVIYGIAALAFTTLL